MEESPFTPGVGREPKHLAGRDPYITDYQSRLGTTQIQQKNTLIVGLRGVGKSVLLKTLSRTALAEGWVPILRELSKRNNSEDELIHALLADLALRLKGVTISRTENGLGLSGGKMVEEPIDLSHLAKIFSSQAGDKGDKLQATLEHVSHLCVKLGYKGLAILFDEFQVLEDSKDQYSLTLVLDAISKLQSSTNAPIHGVFAGLPTMQNKMVESKPHVERLFSHLINLGALNTADSREAILEPLKTIKREDRFSGDLVDFIAAVSEGYPYFIQYYSNEAFTNFQHSPIKKSDFEKILPEIHANLDEHFYTPRFSSLSTKERAVTLVTAKIAPPFTPSDVLNIVSKHGGEVTMGTIQQYLLVLQEKNIIYKVRRGSYDYALPLFRGYLIRCHESGEDPSPVLKELGQK